MSRAVYSQSQIENDNSSTAPPARRLRWCDIDAEAAKESGLMPVDRFRRGDVVVVRQAADILATLDATSALDAVPFMPEMLQYIGRQVTVSKRVEKICDTICPVGSRRMLDTVFLDDLRCDGAGHGGCQASCRIYWKEAWLTRGGSASTGASDPAALAALTRIARDGAMLRATGAFRCQATDARKASTPMQRWHPGQYIRELASGNQRFGAWLRVMLRAVFWEAAARAGLLKPSLASLSGAARTPPALLNLRPGEWVEVRSADEIARTLDAKGTNRGLYFSAPEMVPACGKQYRVRRKVERIVDERNGKLLELKNDCVELEGIVCDGDRSVGRWFCAREIYPYWREAWLKRVPSAAEPESVGGTAQSATRKVLMGAG
jgi:hypothetical protein